MIFNQNLHRYILVLWFSFLSFPFAPLLLIHSIFQVFILFSFNLFINLTIFIFPYFLLTSSFSILPLFFQFNLILSYLILSHLILSYFISSYTCSKISHDVHSYVIGLGVCILAHTILQFIHKDLLSNKAYLSKISLTAKWIAIAVKTVVLGTVWLTIPPFIIGETHTHTTLFCVISILFLL